MILNQGVLTVQVGKVKIDHNGTINDVDLPKLTFNPDALVGFEDVPAFRSERPERPFSHGIFPEVGYSGGRLMSLTGHAFATNETELLGLRDLLASELNTGRLIPIKVTSYGSTRQVSGTLEGGLSWTRVLDNYASWKFDIFCPDPRLYGDWKYGRIYSSDLDREGLAYNVGYPLNYSNTLEGQRNTILQNNGNSVAYPIYTLNADTEGFSIKSGTNVITYSGSTAKSTKLEINTYTGEVRYGQSDRSYLLTQRKWVTIPAYSQIEPELDFVASPELEGEIFLEVKYRDTWL